MEPVLIGYFPKRVALNPDWLKSAGVKEICSASCCISEEPHGWIDQWQHNDLWVFSSENVARYIIPQTQEASEFEIHAYRMAPIRFDEGKRFPFPISEMQVQPLPAAYHSLGYDVVSRSCGTTFECSPLSCNKGAEQFSVNQYCLLEDLNRAMELGDLFSLKSEGWEPGPYFVVEILRRE